MSLDANLFTLNFVQNKDEPSIIDLVDPSDNPHYRKQRLQGTEYKINVYEPLSGSLLASVTAQSPTSKVKVIELHNPSHTVELRYTGTLTFKWRFEWEQHEFEWRREECYIIRKPDPAVLVAVAKEPSGRIRTSTVQILDYNLNRFDIDDRKGLEILILTALLTFQDTNEAYHTPQPSTPAADTTTSRSGFFGTARRVSDNTSANNSAPSSTPPALPPKPAPKSGADKIAELHAVQAARGEGEANEVLVGEEGDAEEYAKYAEGLLCDEAMLFVTIKSESAAQVPKVLQVVEHTKRLRHKAGLDQDQELFQYVIYDTGKKGPRIINLDDNGPNHANYAPPTSLSVHLSKIDMPELRPRLENLRTGPSMRARPAVVDSPITLIREDKGKFTGRANEKEEKEQEKAHKKAEKEAQRRAEREAKEAKKAEKNKKATSGPPRPNTFTKPTVSSPSSTASTSLRPNNSFQRTRPPSFHAPPSQQINHPSVPLYAMRGPSFRQPSANHSFYGGVPYPSDPQTHRLNAPPPMHPSTRPQSFYGSGPDGNESYGGYAQGYYGRS
ncbi:hypothetical protein BDY19DRAFT_964703 [Irpex rosettiformis]|uniref:Uncharacterized protein n=1 Tax=Irpex rosettiformis TaxID=378272 RepID=A0ACB8TUX8_9APHY|nr:hypothetical protein BDY19DRAFT_964703 [Irpex rosettiformis]